jgi:hypothetical protein
MGLKFFFARGIKILQKFSKTTGCFYFIDINNHNQCLVYSKNTLQTSYNKPSRDSAFLFDGSLHQKTIASQPKT